MYEILPSPIFPPRHVEGVGALSRKYWGCFLIVTFERVEESHFPSIQVATDTIPLLLELVMQGFVCLLYPKCRRAVFGPRGMA
jgi:hypothetical protein